MIAGVLLIWFTLGLITAIAAALPMYMIYLHSNWNWILLSLITFPATFKIAVRLLTKKDPYIKDWRV